MANVKIMLSAGETSGDLHGARIAGELKRQEPGMELVGFGGDRMAEQGVRLWHNFKNYNVMGVWEVLVNLRRIWELLRDLEDHMRQERPDLLVLIDYPDFNWRLARRAKALGIPVFSFIPPSAWAWRKGRAKECAAIADEFVSIFPFELKPYEEAGAKISFLGNPLVDAVKASISADEAREFFGLERTDQIVLLMPGSRRQEIHRLFAPMLQAAGLLLQERPNTRFFLPVADGVDETVLQRMTSDAGIPVTLTHEYRYDLMGLADVAIATSGTVVMEAALMGLPCVVLYRMAAFNYLIGKLLVHVEHISLPNILLGRRALPELLQDEVRPARIAEEARGLYRGERHRDEVTEALAKACHCLGEPGAASRIAARVLAAAKRGMTGENNEKL